MQLACALHHVLLTHCMHLLHQQHLTHLGKAACCFIQVHCMHLYRNLVSRQPSASLLLAEGGAHVPTHIHTHGLSSSMHGPLSGQARLRAHADCDPTMRVQFFALACMHVYLGVFRTYCFPPPLRETCPSFSCVSVLHTTLYYLSVLCLQSYTPWPDCKQVKGCRCSTRLQASMTTIDSA